MPENRITTGVLCPSQTIDRRFTILKELGSGGSGSVYQVEDLRDGGIVALKVLTAAGRKHREKLLRFRREFRATSALDHPNIVRVHEFVTGRPSYFTMEYIEGRDVAAYLSVGDHGIAALNHPRRTARLFAILDQIAGALAYVHDHRIVHRDLKPANILVFDAPADGGSAPLVKLMDFGLARDLRDSAALTLPGVVLGTLAFVSPEQATSQPIDGRADLYALGVILYKLLTGTLPFTTASVSDMLWKHYATPPEPPRLRNPGVHRHLERICLRLLEKDPSARFQTAAEVRLLVTKAAGFAYPMPDEVQLKAASSAGDAALLFAPRLVGRTTELRSIGAILETTRTGASRAVLVVGDIGSGRSRLLHEVLARSPSTRPLWTRCLRDDPRPFGGLRLALAAIAEWLHTIPNEQARGIVGDDVGILARNFPELHSLRSRVDADGDSISNDVLAEGRHEEVSQAVSRLLTAAASAGLTLLVVDDIDEADPATFDVIARLCATSPESARVMSLLASTAPTNADTIADRLDAERFDLSPLGLTDVVSMMRSTLGQHELPPSTVDAVHRIAGHRPGHIEELVRFLVRERALRRKGGQWVEDSARRDAVVDATCSRGIESIVDEAITLRLTSLSATARALLDGAALLGSEVSFELLVWAAGGEEDDAVDAVDALLRDGLLVEGRSDGSLAVRTELIERVVRGELRGRRCATLANRLVDALDEPERRATRDPAVVARLRKIAGDVG